MSFLRYNLNSDEIDRISKKIEDNSLVDDSDGMLISLAKKYLSNSLLIGLASAILAVIFDIILEPIAIKFGYWNWSNIDVPLHNYIAWFLIAFFFSYFFSKFKIETKKTIPIHYLIVQFMFFFVLNIFLIWT